jgi:hypothetical protein
MVSLSIRVAAMADTPFSFFEENAFGRDFDDGKRVRIDFVIPAWTAGIQVDMDVFGSIPTSLDAGHTLTQPS